MPHSIHRSRSLAACLALTLITPALAQHADEAEESRLPVVVVSATGVSENAQIATPFSLVEGDEILRQGKGTLGEALDGLPGVHVDTFGAGAGRPIIRGQGAPRVKVLSDSLSLLDASDISPDHAVTGDPLLLRRVEVLRGPATLLYGSGAVGGIVNLLDDKVPSELPAEGIEGMVALRANSVAGERAGAASLTAAIGSSLALHAELSHRDADDYKVPGREAARVEGSDARSSNGSAGLSWVGDNGHVGLAWSRRSDDYGLPGHDHAFEDCHPHGGSLHCGEHDHDHDDEHDEHDHASPAVDLDSSRVDLRGEFLDPFAAIHRIRFRASHTDYRHDEIDDGQIETTFRNKGHEERIEFEHHPVGRWSGIFGLQHADTRFSAEGSEAFLPVVDTRSSGLFVVEHLDLSERWHLELGARREWLRHQPVDDARARPAFSKSVSSWAGALAWSFRPGYSLNLALADSRRLPHAQELYARGIHMATNTWECGLLPDALTCGGAENDAGLRTETARNAELRLKKDAGPFRFELGAYRNQVDHYIHASSLDRVENFRLVKYAQRDATFTGFEAEANYAPSANWQVSVFGDRVRARFDNGDALPRMPPARIGARLDLDLGNLGAQLEYISVSRQTRIAEFEAPTPGHELLNLGLDYRLGKYRQTSVFLQARNLLDQQIWNHSSFLADVIPLPGRNVSLGLRHEF